MNSEQLKSQIIGLTEQYYRAVEEEKRAFRPGKTRVDYGGRVYNEAELSSLVDSSLQFWLTAGRYTRKFERGLASTVRVRYASFVNSGSSANLLAFSTLTSPWLGERRIRPGDEVISVAAGFPTTVAPTIQYGAVPVFVDVDLRTMNVDVSLLEAALSEKTKAVMIAHTLGNPFDIDAVLDFCTRHNLWLVEDNRDGLGSTYTTRLSGKEETRPTGSFGHLATSSFSPAHHITTGEGGAVYTDDEQLERIMNSVRDRGRDCWCMAGQENTCGLRFSQRFGELPMGYDHKCVYTHFGYNLKASDMQAAVGLAQLDKLDEFTQARKDNFVALRDVVAPYSDFVQVIEPTEHSDPSWFGFMVLVKDEAPFTRDEIVAHLESNKIQTRMLFAGNLLKHPCFDEMRETQTGYRVVGDLANTDRIMNTAFWVGVYPGLTGGRLEHMLETLDSFLGGRVAATV